jgi:hypothetical protein
MNKKNNELFYLYNVKGAFVYQNAPFYILFLCTLQKSVFFCNVSAKIICDDKKMNNFQRRRHQKSINGTKITYIVQRFPLFYLHLFCHIIVL